MLRICQQCEKQFRAKPSEVKRGYGRFCSKSCASKWRVANGKSGAIGTPQNGANNSNWKGGRIRHIKGYVMIHYPNHYRADANGYVMEHIIVAEKKLGRLLWPWEVVHHKNGKKDDNRPENLELFSSTAEHSRYHAKLRRVE